MKMTLAFLTVVLVTVSAVISINSAEKDLCAGLKAGRVYFFDREISRDSPLPKPVNMFEFGKPMYALACLTDPAGPQEPNGNRFRVVLSVKQTKSADDRYSSYRNARQEGVFRPELSIARRDIIIYIHEDFMVDSLSRKLDPGEYEYRLQAASETATDTYDITFDLTNDVAYIQQLRKAGYLADGKVKVVKGE